MGPYTVVRKLGAGAFGQVFEALKEPLGKRVALKVLHHDKAQDESVNARFVQEARAAASLKHPHIVDVDDIGVFEGIPYIAMEFLEGETLMDYLEREGPLSPEATLEVLLPVLSAAAAVHARGIVHRDLKPDNVFLWKPVAGQLHPKLLDFGIAKVREGQAMELTKSGAVMGTPMYMSPEQWGGSKYASAQSDQWALGVIAFRCLTGRLPFEADELQALMMRVSMQPAPPLRVFAPSLPTALDLAVMRALEKNPGNRHGSVREFARALLPFASPSTRSRWVTEFGGDVASQFAATADASSTSRATPSIPDTLNSSVKEITSPAEATPRRRRALWAVGLLGGAALTVTAVVALLPTGDGASPQRPSAPPAQSSPEAPRLAAPARPAPVAVRVPSVSPAAPPPGPAPVAQAPAPVVAPRPTVGPRGGRHSTHRDSRDRRPVEAFPSSNSIGPSAPALPPPSTPII